MKRNRKRIFWGWRENAFKTEWKRKSILKKELEHLKEREEEREYFEDGERMHLKQNEKERIFWKRN